ncbi:metallophosphoesterase family protein [Candidatus Leptofilum sp.]|uniref:metallophosphoesterase family protein n=1 Tax=Candidatus Leptofilum sp. TaxID=3241576 RepID=UPI003B5C8556
MRLLAISDLHLNHAENWAALSRMPAHPNDWLIVAGDMADKLKHFRQGMDLLSHRFGKIFWTPGNHDLWTIPSDKESKRGLAKYLQLVEICREFGVHSPQDPFVQLPNTDPPLFIAPTFTLYDYSFRPDDIPADEALAWAEASGVVATDEIILHPDPYPSRRAWCEVRCRYTEKRLAETAAHGNIILINHYPLRYDLVNLRWIPRFSLWCGTKLTEDWHTRFPVTAVVYGHLHIRGTHYRDGVRFEEVSLGYPQNWQPERGIEPYLRQIWPFISI